MTFAERVEVSAGRAVAGVRGGDAGLRANDGIGAGACVASGFTRRGGVRVGGVTAVVAAGFGAGTEAGPDAVARVAAAITRVAAFAVVAARAGSGACMDVVALARAGGAAGGAARVDIGAVGVEAGGGGVIGVAVGGRVFGGCVAVTPVCPERALIGIAAASPAVGAAAGIVTGPATTDDFGVNGAGRTGIALLAGADSDSGAGDGAEPATGRAASVCAVGTSCDACARTFADVAVALVKCPATEACFGVSGMGDRRGDVSGGTGITGSVSIACESRADGISAGAATAILRERRGTAGLSTAAVFVLVGARLGRDATSVVAIELSFGVDRRFTGFAGTDASPGATGAALAMVALRLRGGFGRSASSMSRV